MNDAGKESNLLIVSRQLHSLDLTIRNFDGYLSNLEGIEKEKPETSPEKAKEDPLVFSVFWKSLPEILERMDKRLHEQVERLKSLID